jgi:hypothetical protein
MLICNTISLAMFELDKLCGLDIELLTERQVSKLIDAVLEYNDLEYNGTVRSVVGHADTAKLFSNILGRDIAFNRESVSKCREKLLIGQYTGPRLQEGVTSIPDGAKIEWLLVSPRFNE